MNFTVPNAKTDAPAVWQALAVLGQEIQSLASAQMGNCSFQVRVAPESPTLAKLLADFIQAKARAGRSERYLRTLGYSLGKFIDQNRRDVPAASVTTDTIEKWLYSVPVSQRTLCGYLGDLRTLFSFALKRGLVNHNPAMAVEMPEPVQNAIVVHTPAQAQDVLNFAARTDKDICRALAIRYFSGLRTAEVERITEDNIHPETIEVTAAKSKTRQRRLVTIQPNLRAWLALGGVLPSPKVTDRRMVEFTAKLKRETGIPWPHNVTRHSFVSYHLAKFENAGKTALEAGHAEQILFNHYRQLVGRPAAIEYFSIMPKAVH